MTKRWKTQQLNNRKFSNEDDSDDDFQLSSSPVKSRKSKKKSLSKKSKTDDGKENKLECVENKRNTRTSNVDSHFEKDIQHAIEISKQKSKQSEKHEHKVEKQQQSMNNSNKPSQKSSDEEDVKLLKKKCSYSPIILSDDDDYGDDNDERSSKKEIQQVRNNESSSSTTVEATQLVERKDKCNLFPPIQSDKMSDMSSGSFNEEKMESPKLVSASSSIIGSISRQQSSASNSFNSNVGKLRLGLSRNSKVSKPLHRNMNYNKL